MTGVPAYADSFGYSLAMRVMQSDLYRGLDAAERAECDELIRRGQDAAGVMDAPAAVYRCPHCGVAEGHMHAKTCYHHHKYVKPPKVAPGVKAAPARQQFIVASIKHKAGTVVLETPNLEDVRPTIESGQRVLLVPCDVQGNGNG